MNPRPEQDHDHALRALNVEVQRDVRVSAYRPKRTMYQPFVLALTFVVFGRLIQFQTN